MLSVPTPGFIPGGQADFMYTLERTALAVPVYMVYHYFHGNDSGPGRISNVREIVGQKNPPIGTTRY